MPPGQLSIRAANGKVNYMQLLPAEPGSKRIRRGITKNPQLVQELARKKYLQKSLELLQKNIPALEKLVAVHKAPTTANIIELMPKFYKELQTELFLPELRNTEGWASEEFEQSAYKPEARTQITGKGLRVRSKSEVIIADKLDAHRIPYRYEQMLYIENQSFSPDFTILCGKELVYWEHCGLVNDHSYMRHHKWKLSMYEKAGIVPWKNLIVTYDDERGNLDTRIIESEITNRLL